MAELTRRDLLKLAAGAASVLAAMGAAGAAAPAFAENPKARREPLDLDAAVARFGADTPTRAV